MTKKFWKDWQNRIGETKDIELNVCVFNKNNGRCYYHSVLSSVEYLTLHRTEINNIEFIKY